MAAVLLVCLVGQSVSAQRIGNSPYSQIGIGELYYPGYAPNFTMGGVGTAYANGVFINNINPALLSRNRSATFDIGFAGGWKQLRTQEASQRNLNLNLGYLAMAFPATRRWTMSLNLAPFSSVNYEIASRGTVTGSNEPAQITYRGFNGLTAVSFNNGVSVYRKEDKENRVLRELSVGLQTSYVFGPITKEAISRAGADSVAAYSVAQVRRTNYSDFFFKPGIAYRQRVNDRTYLNLGATYDISRTLNGNRFRSIQYRAAADADSLATYGLDTVGVSTKLPATYQFGVSLDAPLHWAIAADVSFRRWSDLEGGDNLNFSLRNGITVGLGGEWTPNINSINNYFSRSTYRFGVNYAQMPLVSAEGEQLRDMSVRAGVFLPITPGDRRSLSYFNLGVAVGQRGQIGAGLVRERYVNVVLGITINDFGWFLKPKID
jgi:hypothetical protein